MPKEIAEVLLRQHEIAWSLASYHLNGLSTEECLWRPSTKGLHVSILENGSWRGEWPDHEGYDIGPPSMAWLLWHMSFWWSMAINHSFEDSSLDQKTITCPNSAAEIRLQLQSFHKKWQGLLSNISDLDILNAAISLDDLRSPPGNRLEALRGDYKGYPSIRINPQWRIVFRWEDSSTYEVAIVDYH